MTVRSMSVMESILMMSLRPMSSLGAFFIMATVQSSLSRCSSR